MKRVICLIDGFNLYHVLHNCHPAHCKWINYRRLVGQFLLPGDNLLDVFYFTAYAHWDVDKVARHSSFIKALTHAGVKTVLGKHKKKYPKCRQCHRSYETFEEKESDVNIAITLVAKAYENEYDKAIIVSADSDFVPAIKMVKAKFPKITIGALIPFNPRKPHIGSDMRKAADFDRNIERGHLLSSRLPDSITLASGEVVTCPPSYKR